jgi:hypothetical protein
MIIKLDEKDQYPIFFKKSFLYKNKKNKLFNFKTNTLMNI